MYKYKPNNKPMSFPSSKRHRNAASCTNRSVCSFLNNKYLPPNDNEFTISHMFDMGNGEAVKLQKFEKSRRRKVPNREIIRFLVYILCMKFDIYPDHP